MLTDNALLFAAAGSVLVGVTTVAYCLTGSSKKTSKTIDEISLSTSNSSKPKKKSKVTKKTKTSEVSTTKSLSYNQDETDEVENDVQIPALEPVSKKGLMSKPQETQKPLQPVPTVSPKVSVVVPSAAAAAPTASKPPAQVPAPATLAPVEVTEKPKKKKATKKEVSVTTANPTVATTASIPVVSTTPSVPKSANHTVASTASPPSAAPVTLPVTAPVKSLEEKIETSPTPALKDETDGWETVDKSKKLKLQATSTSSGNLAASVPASSGAADLPAAPVVETLRSSISVELKKVGLIIGPKGTTLHMLQNMLNVEIVTPKENPATVVAPPAATGKHSSAAASAANTAKAIIHIVGPAENVPVAVKAIQDLCNKGYSSLLEGSDFTESNVSVHPQYIPELIGKAGCVRKALQDHTGAKVIIPANVSREPNAAPIKILIAGSHAKVNEAKKLVKELLQYCHTPVTHPGIVHNEMDVPSSLYNLIIGARGSEIKHIQANFKVNVHIPNDNTVNKNVLITGEPQNVANASKYIQKIIDQANTDKQAAILAADLWAQKQQETAEQAAEGEEWMQQYLKPKVATHDISGNEIVPPAPGMTLDHPGPEGSDFNSMLASRTIKTDTVSSTTSVNNGTKLASSWASTVLSSAEGW